MVTETSYMLPKSRQYLSGSSIGSLLEKLTIVKKILISLNTIMRSLRQQLMLHFIYIEMIAIFK